MLEAFILGIVQGITEFLPISSTAHLIIVPWFCNWAGEVNTLTFDVALHAGTLLSLLLCFWKDWKDLITKKQRLLGFIILASIPAGVTGLLLNDIVESELRNPLIICTMLVVIGFLMLYAERTIKQKDIEQTTLRDALIIGFAQALAIIPGVSRSGITIAAGLMKGFRREEAARFSFLLSTPIIAGATLLHLKKLAASYASYDLHLFLLGFATSAFTGFFAIKFLLNFLKKYPLNLFVYYRFLLSAIIIAGIWLRR